MLSPKITAISQMRKLAPPRIIIIKSTCKLWDRSSRHYKFIRILSNNITIHPLKTILIHHMKQIIAGLTIAHKFNRCFCCNEARVTRTIRFKALLHFPMFRITSSHTSISKVVKMIWIHTIKAPRLTQSHILSRHSLR